MNELSINKYFRFISFMLIISVFLPLLFANLPRYVKSHHVWAVLWFVSLLVFKPYVFRNKLVLFFLIYGAVMVFLLFDTIWVNIDEWNKRQFTKEFYHIIVAISVIIYFRLEKDYLGLANLVKWTMVFIFITAIMSIVTTIINPMYARDIVGISSIDISHERVEILSYRKYGGGGYGFASAIVCLFPMLIFYYKNSEKSYWNKRYLLLFAIIIFLTLIRMQIFANILISVVILVFSLLGRKNVVKARVYISALVVILVLIPMSFYVDIFIYVGSWFDKDSENYFKLNDMAQYIANSNKRTAAGYRMERYPLLWESFISNPLYGGKYWNIHLFWMNKLAVYGLLGTIPFLIIIYSHIKNNLRYFDKEFAFYFLLSMLSIIALGSMKALEGRELWYVFFIIIPGFYYMPLIKKKKKFHIHNR